MNWSDEMIEKTMKVFRPYATRAGEDFTRENAIESLNNVVAFFELLIEVDKKHGSIEEESKR